MTIQAIEGKESNFPYLHTVIGNSLNFKEFSTNPAQVFLRIVPKSALNSMSSAKRNPSTFG